MPEDVNGIEFTVFDLETTGLEPESGDRIIEVAAVRMKAGHRLSVFHSLVNPGQKELSPAAFAINHISRQMLKDAPPISEVMPAFLEFISGSCLAAYNASFDFSFLSSESDLISLPLPEGLQVVDILIMARRTLPGLPRYALEFVARSLGMDAFQEHRALSDAQMTAEVFNRLKDMLIKKGIADFEQFLSLFGLNSRLLDNINNAKVARIQEALNLGMALKIQYLSHNNAEFTEREVIPRAIVQERNQVYLVGFCNLRKQERTFKIKNILHLEMVGERR